ncbi:hypothetical protein [Cytobacillus gottheilii]|uniref:hypothetical protein n=1 Tax=Cytobacillus gottheilii TaxID=859144 RepID=UPI0009B96599|nr:hypothetical protein [Cytobacillus gottheilii]
MIKDKVIKFGYGTVLVGSNELLRTVELGFIELPNEIGMIYKQSDLGDTVTVDSVKFKYDADMPDFYKELENLSENNPIVEFRGFTFDFTKYNEESVKVVRNGFKNAIIGFRLALAF